MHRIKAQHWLLVGFTCMLLMALVVGAKLHVVRHHPPLTFCIHSGSCTETVQPIRRDDGGYDLYLPSYAAPEQVTVVIPDGHHVTIDGREVPQGMALSEFEQSKPLPMITDGGKSSLCILRSANVAALYVDTRTGSMDHVDASYDYKEQASIRLYDATGVLDTVTADATLKSRGNSTWFQDKKPYSLTCAANIEPLGMKDGRKWVLLANAFDSTNIRNALIYDMAPYLNMGWSPSYRYVDAYFDGEYRGLYMLAEKVEVDENRLDIPREGSYLFSKTQDGKVKAGEYSFALLNDVLAVVVWPKDRQTP